MKSNQTTPVLAVKAFAYTLLAAVLCFFLHLSITMALSISSTEKLGTRVRGTLEDGRALIVEEYTATADTPATRRVYIMDADGGEEVLTEHEIAEDDDGDKALLEQYPITASYSENIRSDLSDSTRRTSNAVAQVLMAILFFAFPYSNMWYTGDHDRNSVQFGHQAADRWRGAKIGGLASIPAAAAWLVLVVGKLFGTLPGYVKWYRWMNVCFWPYFNCVIPSDVMNPSAVSWGGVAAMLPVLVALPLITGLGYYLGFRGVSVRDRLVYAATGKKPKRKKVRRP